jgi:hypothetical protein
VFPSADTLFPAFFALNRKSCSNDHLLRLGGLGAFFATAFFATAFFTGFLAAAIIEVLILGINHKIYIKNKT